MLTYTVPAPCYLALNWFLIRTVCSKHCKKKKKILSVLCSKEKSYEIDLSLFHSKKDNFIFKEVFKVDPLYSLSIFDHALQNILPCFGVASVRNTGFWWQYRRWWLAVSADNGPNSLYIRSPYPAPSPPPTGIKDRRAPEQKAPLTGHRVQTATWSPSFDTRDNQKYTLYIQAFNKNTEENLKCWPIAVTRLISSSSSVLESSCL